MRRAFFCLLALLAALCLPAALSAAQAEPLDEAARLAAEDARREAVLIAAVKNLHVLPTPGIMPRPAEIPLSDAWEDPDWNTPLMQSIYKNPYSYGNNLDNYQACLGEAVGGNPRAMLAISMYCYLWGDVLEDRYPDFPPQAHSVDFWRDWAARLAGPGWVCLRLGDLHGRWPSSSMEYYRQAAELGSAEGMYNYYKTSGKRRDYLYRSAALGYAKAAFLLGEELEKQGGENNLALSRRYTWLAAVNADEWGLLHSSFAFYNGEFDGLEDGRAGDCEQGYLYAILNIRYQQGGLFSTQRPENICMLPPDTVSRLEAAADRWQVDYDLRRLPHILRARYRNAPLLETLRGLLAPVEARLGLTRPADEAPPLARPASRAEVDRVLPLAWHLGFFSDAQEKQAGGAALPGSFAYAGERFALTRVSELFLVYAFVILSILLGAGFIVYSRIKKREKKRRSKKGGKAARPRQHQHQHSN